MDINSDAPFDFFKDWTVEKQNFFLEDYLINTTKYLLPVEFPNSPNHFYYYPEYRDNDYNGNSIKNLAALLILLINRDVIWPIRFLNNHPYHAIGTLQPYFIFTNWPIGNLNDTDFYSFEYVQENEFLQMANVLAN